MAVAVTIDQTFSLGETKNLYIGRFSPDSSWLAAGEVFDVAAVESFEFVDANSKGGIIFEFRQAGQLVLAYWADLSAAVDSAQIPVPDATDLSTACANTPFIAVGK